MDMMDEIKILTNAIEAQPDGPEKLLVLAGIGLLTRLLVDVSRAATALERIATDLESRPD